MISLIISDPDQRLSSRPSALRSLPNPPSPLYIYNIFRSEDTGTKPSDVENKVTVSAFARRRLAVVMVRLKMAETVADVSRGCDFDVGHGIQVGSWDHNQGSVGKSVGTGRITLP